MRSLLMFLLTRNEYLFPLLFFSLPRIASGRRQLIERMWSMNCGPAAPHQLAALLNCLILLPNYLSTCNALQLLRYNTTLNAFGKSEFHLVGYIYSLCVF